MRLNTVGTIFKAIGVIGLLLSIAAFFLPIAMGVSGFDTIKAGFEVNYGTAWGDIILYIIVPLVLLVVAAFVLIGSTTNGACIAVIVMSVVAIVLYLYPYDFDIANAFKYLGWGFKLTFISALCGIVAPIIIMICGRDKGGRTYTMEDDFHAR